MKKFSVFIVILVLMLYMAYGLMALGFVNYEVKKLIYNMYGVPLNGKSR